MSFTAVMPALAVSDFDAGVAWYERFFGRPADRRPMDGLAEWDVTEGGTVQVVRDVDRAGRATATLAVDNLDTTISDLNSRGLHVGDVVEGAVAKLTRIDDPEGNTLILAEPF